MPMVECPHCLNTVFPMANHGCPGCSKDTRAPNTSPVAKVTVTPKTRFPECCCECEASTMRLETLRGVGHGAESLWLRILTAIGFVLFKPSLLSSRRDELAGDPELFRLQIPRCADCAKKGPLIPNYVNEQQASMTLLVKRGFATATRALNA